MSTTRPLKVFLCHASADKPAVRKLYRYLKDRKIDAWLDAEKLLGGQNWRDEIPKAIKSSDAIIVCLSKNSVNKEGYVQKEIKFALDKADEMPSGRIFIIPAKLEECDVPSQFSDYHWVNLFEEDGYRRLMKSLRLRAAQIETVTDISDVPHVEDTEPVESRNDSKDGTIDVGGDVSGANIIVGNHNVIHVTPQPVGQVSNLTDAPDKKESWATKSSQGAIPTYEYKPVTKPEPKKQSNIKFPTWGIGLIVFAFLALAIWGLSSIPTSPEPTETPFATQTVFTEPATETPVPVTSIPTIIPTPTPSIMNSEKDGATLVYVPAGEFTMGSDNGEADEKPVHTVYLDAFWIDQTEVTNKQYQACVDAGMCEPPSSISSSTHPKYYGNTEFDNYPVIYVNWDKANRYCEVWTGGDLPSETQWEKAASWDESNQTKRMYPWGNDAPNDTLLNYNQKVGDTTKVGNYEIGKSFYGAYDMAGNVWEWVNDWYSDTYYQSSPSSNPSGPNSGQYRVLRGGSWYYLNDIVRSAFRLWIYPTYASDNYGFRCARSP